MTADAPTPPSDDETAWYEGLRGGSTTGPAADQGRLWRAHLRAEADADAPPKTPPRPWAEVRAEHEARQSSAPSAAPSPDQTPTAAANDPWWRQGRSWAVAATVAVVCALPMWRAQQALDDDGSAQRGGGSVPGATAPQRWRHAEPAQAAQQLAEHLRSDGAEVTVLERGGTVYLKVKAAPPHLDAVTATLAALELSLDGQGQADIQIEAGP